MEDVQVVSRYDRRRCAYYANPATQNEKNQALVWLEFIALLRLKREIEPRCTKGTLSPSKRVWTPRVPGGEAAGATGDIYYLRERKIILSYKNKCLKKGGFLAKRVPLGLAQLPALGCWEQWTGYFWPAFSCGQFLSLNPSRSAGFLERGLHLDRHLLRRSPMRVRPVHAHDFRLHKPRLWKECGRTGFLAWRQRLRRHRFYHRGR
jgi:hypothetical protein